MYTNESQQDPSTKTTRPGYWLRAIQSRRHELGREYRGTFDEMARVGVSDKDYATTMATLEKMATNLGWIQPQPGEVGPNPSSRLGRGRGRGRGRGTGYGRSGRRGLSAFGATSPQDQTPTAPPEA